MINKNKDNKYTIIVNISGYIDTRHSKLRSPAEKAAEKSKKREDDLFGTYECKRQEGNSSCPKE